MYQQHATKIQDYAQRNASNMADTGTMTFLSVRQPWFNVGDQLQDVRVNKADSSYLWGFKKDSYNYIIANKHKIHGQMMAVINSNKSDDDKALSLMKVFLRVPGLGLSKAGFMCQLCAGLVGCMDVHNIKLYGLDVKDLTLPKTLKSQAKKEEKIKKYITICHDYGTESLWNSWCDHLATKSAKWTDSFHVSEVHYTYLTQSNPHISV